MDAYEATRIVFSRIQALDPDNAAKIMGLLLIQDHGEKEMIRLAFGPEALLHSVILKARKDLGLYPSSAPSTPSPILSRQNSSSRGGPNSPSSWAPHLPFSRSNISDDGCGGDNDFLLQEQLSFLNEQANDPAGYCDQGGFGWKPCLYFARGFCKNGSTCRFLHGPADDMSAAAAAEQQCQELMLMRSKSQRLAASAAAAAAVFPYSPTGSSSCKNLNFMLQQQQNESQRAAAAAAAALMFENENHKFMGRPRLERDFAGMVNPGSRQIYLTFPADSTFREEDVSNYFSIYGPVQDVRIPYQQKRMFGFVTFVYSETVKLILAKGNPHFVCDARVLVKPYKEKGKIPDKKQQHGERFDFSGCTTPTGLDSRDPFDLQQLVASPRMMYGGNNHDVLLRRKMEEQQAAAELQQAIEMQGRRFMGLQLLDIKNRSLASSTAPILSPLATPNSNPFSTAVLSDGGRSSNGSQDEDKSLSPAASGTAALSAAAAAVGVAVADKQQPAVNSSESVPTPNEDISYQESAEHNLPDSPFASPTKSVIVSDSSSFTLASEESSLVTSNGSSKSHLIASALLPPSSPLENMASFNSCFFQIPRFSSGHGAVGL